MARPIELTDALGERIAGRVRNGVPPETATSCEGYSIRVFYNWQARGERDRETGEDTVFARFVHSITRAKSECFAEMATALREGLLGQRMIVNEKSGASVCAIDTKAAIEFLKRRDQKMWDPPRADAMTLALEKAQQENASSTDIETAVSLLESKLAALKNQLPPR